MSEVISWLLDSADCHCEIDGPESIRARHLREAATELSALDARVAELDAERLLFQRAAAKAMNILNEAFNESLRRYNAAIDAKRSSDADGTHLPEPPK